MAKTSIHAFVSGKVQGVWYRAFARDQAQAVAVTGWAKNLPDGRVEVLLCGEQAAVLQVVDALRKGPPNAAVSAVTTQERAWQAIEGFTIS